jgi:GTP-binding protein
VVHVVDPAPIDGSDPVANVRVIRTELAQYAEDLTRRPELLVANKADLPDAEAGARRLRDAYGEVITVSAATGDGLTGLVQALFARLFPPGDARPRETGQDLPGGD